MLANNYIPMCIKGVIIEIKYYFYMVRVCVVVSNLKGICDDKIEKNSALVISKIYFKAKSLPTHFNIT